MKVHVSAVSSALGDYCEIEAWIRAKLYIKKPASDVMLLGTITHYLLEMIDDKLKFDKVDSIAGINDLLTEYLVDSYIKFKSDNPANYDSIEERVLDYIDCLAYRFTSRYYKIQLLGKEYKSNWVTEEPMESKYDIDGTQVILVGRIDRYKLVSMTKCVVADYKTSATPKITDSMKIQLDGYALLLYEKYGFETVIGQIDFPIYQITEYYIPNREQFKDVYLPLYIETMARKKLPPYYPRKSCTYCQSEVRKECLKLRPK